MRQGKDAVEVWDVEQFVFAFFEPLLLGNRLAFRTVAKEGSADEF